MRRQVVATMYNNSQYLKVSLFNTNMKSKQLHIITDQVPVYLVKCLLGSDQIKSTGIDSTFFLSFFFNSLIYRGSFLKV